ncbi:hypothetical protein BPA30113_06415 [Burkholderia paludis]|uniref:Uncharacterized protein n=1 Tax=Burkholderia paludis TaxID=1506587 RepID=A0A6J5EUP4_9BURK|nr:hypothetical protein LMG30113_05802 [Burkholderia paludis]VWC33174.1 hypothetical protein BPA30113_06415 [Burkholderia paludis]
MNALRGVEAAFALLDLDLLGEADAERVAFETKRFVARHDAAPERGGRDVAHAGAEAVMPVRGATFAAGNPAARPVCPVNRRTRNDTYGGMTGDGCNPIP